MNNSRFDALAMTVHELGFVEDIALEAHPLSDAGRLLLDTGDLLDRPLLNTGAGREEPVE